MLTRFALTLLLFAGCSQAVAETFRCRPRDSKDISEIVVVITDGHWNVSHIANSGAVYERMEQYKVSDSTDSGSLFWKGVHRRKRDTKIIGRLQPTIARGGAIYTEDISNAKDGRVARTEADCQIQSVKEDGAGQDKTQEAAPTPPTAPQEPDPRDAAAKPADTTPKNVVIPADPTPNAPVSKAQKDHEDNETVVAALLAIALALALYFTPTIVASRREHMSIGSIFVVNLFFGWTLLGWVLSLAWALNSNTRRNMILYRNLPTDGP